MEFTGILELKPMQGLNMLHFGATMVEAERYFGKPDSIENIDELEDYKSIVWHYIERGFSLFFDDRNHNTFSCVEVDDDKSILWGKPVFKLSEKEIKNMFRDKNFVKIDLEDHEWGERRISFDDAMVDLYFEKEQLVSFNFCVPRKVNELLIFPN